jgi:hypothetical protein
MVTDRHRPAGEEKETQLTSAHQPLLMGNAVTINSYVIVAYVSDRSVWLDGQKKAAAITEKRNRERVGR